MNAHKEHHTILKGLTDHGYCGLDARTKVTCLLDRIKTDLLDAVKLKKMKYSEVCSNFERCATFYMNYIKYSSENQSNEARSIAKVSLYRKGENKVKDR